MLTIFALNALTSKLLEIGLPIIIAPIAALIVAILSRQLQKIGLQLTNEQESQLKHLVVQAIQAAEEQARRGEIPNATKRDVAIQELRLLRPAMSVDDLEQKIDATLPEVRAKLAPVPSTPANVGLPKGPL